MSFFPGDLVMCVTHMDAEALLRGGISADVLPPLKGGVYTVETIRTQNGRPRIGLVEFAESVGAVMGQEVRAKITVTFANECFVPVPPQARLADVLSLASCISDKDRIEHKRDYILTNTGAQKARMSKRYGR